MAVWAKPSSADNLPPNPSILRCLHPRQQAGELGLGLEGTDAGVHNGRAIGLRSWRDETD